MCYGGYIHILLNCFFFSKSKSDILAESVFTFEEEAWERARKGHTQNYSIVSVMMSAIAIRYILSYISPNILEIYKGTM